MTRKTPNDIANSLLFLEIQTIVAEALEEPMPSDQSELKSSISKSLKRDSSGGGPSHIAARESELKLIFKDAPEGEQLDAAKMLRLQKLWFLMGDEIAYQTLVRIDGDVTTRISPNYVDAAQENLPKLHMECVSASTSFWSGLIEMLAKGLWSIFNWKR